MQMNYKTTNNLDYEINFLEKKDLFLITSLCKQLGFEGSLQDLENRFHDLSCFSNHQVRVAKQKSNENIIGFIHFFEAPYLLTCKTLEIGGLVVENKFRRFGIGKILMQEAEKWAMLKGCKSVLLATQIMRTDAQAFYEQIGYQKEFQTFFLRKYFDHI
ncbi:GNAT family N-acetyltransferase [Silvanigrella paludirubra]|uniref:GNAT family N-acetyltransferase n=1 Tax=Silvanigrella paludirubra TaxID=2499159 RepID=A0A6N6VVR1_9BACT|nr:GNAT family N-acetyltransferase [Silvanigrella paludirubra]KAB8037557.1 GNAT family N-acetyltransferase [Silvanigrella paludirubra]